ATQALAIPVNPAKPVISSVGNGTNGNHTVAPGEVATVLGAPFSAAGFARVSGTSWPTTFNNVTVTVNGLAAPIDVVDTNAVVFQVPYETTQGDAVIRVSNGVLTSDPFTFTVAPAAPWFYTGVFFSNVINQNGLSNSSSNPAPAGSRITARLTGVGLVNPPV